MKDNSEIISALAQTVLGKFIPPSLMKKSVDIGQEISTKITAGEALGIVADCKTVLCLENTESSIVSH